jgi:uncharacterized membrane protein YgcG
VRTTFGGDSDVLGFSKVSEPAFVFTRFTTNTRPFGLLALLTTFVTNCNSKQTKMKLQQLIFAFFFAFFLLTVDAKSKHGHGKKNTIRPTYSPTMYPTMPLNTTEYENGQGDNNSTSGSGSGGYNATSGGGGGDQNE